MALSIAEITARSTIFLVLGVVLIAGISTYTARPARMTGISLWIALPIMAAQVCLAAGSLGIGLASGKGVGGGTQGIVAAIVGFVGVLWCTNIVVQVSQNFGYRLVGAPLQPIQWYRGQKRRSHRKMKT